MEANSSNWNIKNLYAKLDIFGIGYNFVIDGKDKYKTTTGASLTVFLSVAMIALFMGFGVDLYERKHPTVSSNTQIGQYKKQTFANNDFTFVYRIDDYTAQLNIDPRVHNFEVWYTAGVLDKTTGVWNTTINEVLVPTRCYDIEGMKEKEKIFKVKLEEWYCIDFKDNFSMGGNFDGDFFHLWQINTVQCINSTENNFTCKSQEEILNAFESKRTSGNLFFNYFYMDAVIAMDNFDSPLSNYLVDRYQMLNLQVTKSDVQIFKNIQMQNDIGWFFPDIQYIDIYSSDSITSDFVLKDQWNQKVLFTYFGYLGKRYDTYIRSYTKIQTVLAAVGGFEKFFYTAIFMFYFYFSKTHRNLNLIDILNKEHEFDLTPAHSLHNNSSILPNNFNNFFQNDKYKQGENDTNNFNTKIFQTKNDLSKSEVPTKADFRLLSQNLDITSKIITPKKEGKINVTFSGLFCYKFFKCCLGKNKKSRLKLQSELYNAEKKLIYNLFDSLNFIKLQKEFHNLKDALLDEQQQIVLSVVCSKNTNIYNSQTYKERITKLLDMLSEPEMKKKIDSDPISKKLLKKLDKMQ